MENLLDLRLKIAGTRPAQKDRLQEDQSQALLDVLEHATTLYVLMRASMAPEMQPGTVLPAASSSNPENYSSRIFQKPLAHFMMQLSKGACKF